MSASNTLTIGAEDRLPNQRTDSLCSFNQNKTESVFGQPGRERDRDYDKTASINKRDRNSIHK